MLLLYVSPWKLPSYELCCYWATKYVTSVQNKALESLSTMLKPHSNQAHSKSRQRTRRTASDLQAPFLKHIQIVMPALCLSNHRAIIVRSKSKYTSGTCIWAGAASRPSIFLQSVKDSGRAILVWCSKAQIVIWPKVQTSPHLASKLQSPAERKS